jgi:hypothetical protein
MGDHSKETIQQLQNRRDDENCAHEHLFSKENYLNLDEESIPWILNHVDCFVSQSRDNISIEKVVLCPYSVNAQDYEVWDKLGRAVSNLKALKKVCIGKYYTEDEDLCIVDWEIVARILSHVRQRITLYINDHLAWDVEESRLFARAIHGHPTITSFEDNRDSPYESLDALYSALATLPALEWVKLSASPEDDITLANPESLAELLRVHTLRSVCFDEFHFTSALCQATANALMEGTAITNLKFRDCSFPAEGSAAIMANGLKRNTSVLSIEVESPFDLEIIDALAAALPLNSTLQDLALSGRTHNDDPDFSRLFWALGNNTGLRTLKADGLGLMDGSLCTAMKDGLGMSETLESLELNGCLCDDNSAMWRHSAMWCSALSFLCNNKALKSLMVTFDEDASKSFFDALCRHMVAMLQENPSLESLTLEKSGYRIKFKAEEYFSLVTRLQHNTTLKSLDFTGHGNLTLTDDEDKQMAALLKKNYGLESLPGINLKNRASDSDAILRLNGAGRRYLVQDGSSISKGVEVMSRVNNDINCLFLHLLENPRLCDRSAVEKVSTGEIANSGGGKREQGSAHKGKESRRRLA